MHVPFNLKYLLIFSGPTKPRNFKLTVTSSKSITASWLEPLKPNGILKRYVVMYGTASSKLDKSDYTGNTTTTYLISGLEEFTEYFFQVYAETSVSGNPSNIEQAKTREDCELLVADCSNHLHF